MKYALGIFILMPVMLFLPLFITVGGDLTGLAWFIHAPTMWAFILVLAGVLLVTGQFKIFVKTANALFSKKYKISAEDRARGIKLLELLKTTVIYTAVFFLFGATIAMLGDIDSLEFLGPMLSIILLIPMYAAILNLVFILPALHILKTRQNEEKPTVISEKEVINKMLELCYKQGIPPEEILGAKEINFR